MTAPSIGPLWSRTASAAGYGGHARLRDYCDIGAVNANTDVTAAQYKRLARDAAAIALTTPIVTMVVNYLSSGSIFVVDYCKPAWAPAVTTRYIGTAPPSSLYPAVAKTTLSPPGCSVTLPSSAQDEFGVSADVLIRVVNPCRPGVYWTPSSTTVAQLDGFTPDAPVAIVIY